MNTTKPILIDALHINMGGALMILNHLIDHLVARDINFVLLKDNRCPVLRSEGMIKTKVIMSCDERSWVPRTIESSQSSTRLPSSIARLGISFILATRLRSS